MHASCHIISFILRSVIGGKVIKVNTLFAYQRNTFVVNALLLFRDRCTLLPSYDVEIRVRFLSKRLLEGIWRKESLPCRVVSSATSLLQQSGKRRRQTLTFPGYDAKATIEMYTTSRVLVRRKFV